MVFKVYQNRSKDPVLKYRNYNKKLRVPYVDNFEGVSLLLQGKRQRSL